VSIFFRVSQVFLGMHAVFQAEAAADWQKASQMKLVEASNDPRPSGPKIESLVNPKKLQVQSPFFKCPEWAGAARKGPFLEVRKGVDVVDHLTIDEQPYYLFGRNAAVVDFVLEHPSISRVHFALVHHAQGDIYIIDLGSGHGCSLNHKQLEKNKPTKLEANAVLQAGASSRTYVLRLPTNSVAEATVPTHFEEKKRAREDEKGTRSKDDGILAGWELPAKKQVKRKQQPEAIHCIHILLRHRDVKRPFDRHDHPIERSKEEALRKLTAFKDEIILNLDGLGPEAKMRKLAKKESDCPSWKTGGDLGLTKKGESSREFEQVAFNLDIGEIGGPVETELGIHLIMRINDR